MLRPLDFLLPIIPDLSALPDLPAKLSVPARPCPLDFFAARPGPARPGPKKILLPCPQKFLLSCPARENCFLPGLARYVIFFFCPARPRPFFCGQTGCPLGRPARLTFLICTSGYGQLDCYGRRRSKANVGWYTLEVISILRTSYPPPPTSGFGLEFQPAVLSKPARSAEKFLPFFGYQAAIPTCGVVQGFIEIRSLVERGGG